MFYNLSSLVIARSIFKTIWNGSFDFPFPKGSQLYLETSHVNTANFNLLNYACGQKSSQCFPALMKSNLSWVTTHHTKHTC